MKTMHTLYNEIVTDVLRGMGQHDWRKKELCGLKRRKEEFKRMLIEMFDV